MRRWAWRIAGGLAALGLVGFLVAASGVVPIGASSGHWAVTEWILQFGKRRSVATHSMGVEPPDLGDPGRILKGAGHYATACQPCHGAPGRPASAVARHATPMPPLLVPRVPRWEPEELFQIVKHGVKFTGMPAWPARERDDEVWAVVAFLRVLPGLDATSYGRLVGEPDDGGGPLAELSSAARPALAGCARCHGRDGRGRGTGAFPVLAGQREAYLAASLRAYARGTRLSGVMEPVAHALPDAIVAEIARYYAARPTGPRPSPPVDLSAPGLSWPVGRASEDPERLRQGEELARRGDPSRKVPSCVPCHGPGDEPRNARYPRLEGQYPDYLSLQLRLFAEGRRGGSSYAHIMHPAASRLGPDQIEAVAAWYGALAPAAADAPAGPATAPGDDAGVPSGGPGASPRPGDDPGQAGPPPTGPGGPSTGGGPAG